MTKNRSKMLIIFLSIVLVIGLLASFVSFTYPLSIGGVHYKYSSFVDELVLGGDISDAVLLEYQANVRENYDDELNYDQLMQNTIVGIRDILEDTGFKNNSVVRQGDKGIRVEVGNITDNDDTREVISLIGEPKQLSFSLSTNADEAFMTGECVEKVEVKEMSNGVQTVYYVEITFTSKGFEIIKDKTKSLAEGSSFYMLLGDTQVGSSSEAVTTRSISMSSENFIDKYTTNQYAVQIRTGMLPLDLICIYNGAISASAGYRGNVSNPMVYIWVAFGIMVIASMVFFAARYKQIGFMAIFNMLFFIVLGLFFLQSVPLVHINLSGIFAIVLSYLVASISLMITLENAKNLYAKGRKLHTSLHQGINMSLTPTLTYNLVLVVGGIVCALMPTMAVQSFGLVAMVLGLVNIFCSQALMRLMINLYLPFNSEDGSKCNFTKEGLNNDK